LNSVKQEQVYLLLSQPVSLTVNKYNYTTQRIYIVSKAKKPIDNPKMQIIIPKIVFSEFSYQLSSDATLQKKDLSVTQDFFRLDLERICPYTPYYLDLKWKGSNINLQNISFDSDNIHKIQFQSLENFLFNK